MSLTVLGAARAVIAIPVRNEEARIGRCLEALSRQELGSSYAVATPPIVLLLNNCTDGSHDAALAAARRLDLDIRLMKAELPRDRATAGWARRLAMEAALEIAPPDGFILTTDADSRPQPGWLAANLKHLDAGADAVAGEIDWDPFEPPPTPSPRRQLEACYAALSFHLIAALDPQAHDPWPNHQWTWGASVAVRSSAYRQVGGMPAVSLAEDRAFQAALERHDFKIRHACDVRVWTSGRVEGRAPGGLADLIRAFDEDEETLCDAVLEPPMTTLRRALSRRRARAAWRSRRADALGAVVLRLRGDPSLASTERRTFGAFWQDLEASSPGLRRQRVAPADLPRFVKRMERFAARRAIAP